MILYFTGFSRSAGSILKEQDDKSKDKNSDMIQSIYAWVMEQYEDGRITMISDDELKYVTDKYLASI